ncbi:MAG: hypothetical protein AABY22_02860 [Nanoarchaeota archaeon]
MNYWYEQTPIQECRDCPYRDDKLCEEFTNKEYGPRAAITVRISGVMACRKESCLLDVIPEKREERRLRSSSSLIFINAIKLIMRKRNENEK